MLVDLLAMDLSNPCLIYAYGPVANGTMKGYYSLLVIEIGFGDSRLDTVLESVEQLLLSTAMG